MNQRVSGYKLPAWVHMCFTREGAIFLDVKNDRYIGLGAQEAAILRRAIHAADPIGSDAESLFQELANGGLICMDGTSCRPLAPTSSVPVEDALIDDPEDSPPISFVHVRRFASACISMWLRFRWGSLRTAIGHLQSSKALLSSTPVDLARVRELCLVFMHLRPFIYTAREHCLFDSLVLADYLRRFGVRASCVFGVSTLPFAAHCWVQVGRSLAIEPCAEEIEMFSPILVV